MKHNFNCVSVDEIQYTKYLKSCITPTFHNQQITFLPWFFGQNHNYDNCAINHHWRCTNQDHKLLKKWFHLCSKKYLNFDLNGILHPFERSPLLVHDFHWSVRLQRFGREESGRKLSRWGFSTNFTFFRHEIPVLIMSEHHFFSVNSRYRTFHLKYVF